MPTNRMKAIRLHAFGGPEVLVYEDVAIPELGPARCSSAFTPSASILPTGTCATGIGRFPTFSRR